MHRLTRYLMVAVTSVLVVIGAVGVALYGYARYVGRRATQCFAAVQGLQLGKATTTEIRTALRPYTQSGDIERSCNESRCLSAIDYSFSDISLSSYRYPFRWTYLEIRIFTDERGILIGKSVTEKQENPDSPHPHAARTTEMIGKGDGMPFFQASERFEGYEVIPMWTMCDPHGCPSGVPVLSRMYVSLDSRATESDRRRAYAFNLDCFYSLHPCDNPRKILNPAGLDEALQRLQIRSE
jgi:hypothetical protein